MKKLIVAAAVVLAVFCLSGSGLTKTAKKLRTK